MFEIEALPGHPPTGQDMSRAVRGKETRYVLGSSGGWGGGIVPQVALGHTILGLPMGCQGPHSQFCIVLGVADPLSDPFLLVVLLPRHVEAIGICRVTTKRTESMKSHTHYLGHICVEAHAVKSSIKVSKAC